MRLKSLKLLPFLLFSLFAFACESGGDLKTDDNGTTEEPDTPITATIEVSEDAVKIPVAGDTHIVIVESSVNWKAESTGKDWITIFPSSGTAGETEVEIMVKNNESNRDRSADIIEKVRLAGIPTIVVINKVDLTTPEKLTALVEKWQALLPNAIIAPCSAKENFNVEGVFNLILERLPEGEAFYPKDTLTDKTLRFFASEIIREKILLNYDKEIPYSCEIAIESYKEEPTIDRISATIFVARNSQKGIVIGHKGERLKRVGQAARHDLEAFLGKKVFLELYVKVMEDWRNNDNQLKRFGYELD